MDFRIKESGFNVKKYISLTKLGEKNLTFLSWGWIALYLTLPLRKIS